MTLTIVSNLKLTLSPYNHQSLALDHLDEWSIYRKMEEVLSSMKVLNGLPYLELVPWRKG